MRASQLSKPLPLESDPITYERNSTSVQVKDTSYPVSKPTELLEDSTLNKTLTMPAYKKIDEDDIISTATYTNAIDKVPLVQY